jgi:formate-dependent nitrite reductase membrane component NrfD
MWSPLYQKTFSGFMLCMTEGLPFYKNDLASTALIVAVAFGLPALVTRIREQKMEHKTPVYATIKSERR